MRSSVRPPNKHVDRLILMILAFEMLIIVYTLRAELDMMGLLLILMGVVAIAVKLIKAAFRLGGRWFSRVFLQHLGNPLKKKTTMKKWCDQSWQLAIHSSMALFEFIVLRDERWWQDTTTCKS